MAIVAHDIHFLGNKPYPAEQMGEPPVEAAAVGLLPVLSFVTTHDA